MPFQQKSGISGVNPPPLRSKREFFSTQNWYQITQGNYLQHPCKNHQNLMRGFEDISSKGPFLSHFSQKGAFWGVNPPLGSKREFFSTQHWCQITQGNYLQHLCKNHQNLMRSFEGISSKGGFLSHFSQKGAFWGVNTPPCEANENFLAHSTGAKSLRATIYSICA